MPTTRTNTHEIVRVTMGTWMSRYWKSSERRYDTEEGISYMTIRPGEERYKEAVAWLKDRGDVPDGLLIMKLRKVPNGP